MPTDSEVAEPPKVRSAFHPEPFGFPVFDFVPEDVSGYSFKQFDLLIQLGFGNDHCTGKVAPFVPGTS